MRLTLFCLSLCLALPLELVAAELSDEALLGCWRAERVQQTYADGRVWNDIGGCTLEFALDRIDSACALRPGNRPVIYTYTISQPGHYTARIVEHPQFPAAVGSEREYEYQIDGDRLYISTNPQTAKPVPLNAVVRVFSVSVRVGSQADRDDVSDREKAGCKGRITGLPPTLPFALSLR
jgi:hypothetical protein